MKTSNNLFLILGAFPKGEFVQSSIVRSNAPYYDLQNEFDLSDLSRKKAIQMHLSHFYNVQVHIDLPEVQLSGPSYSTEIEHDVKDVENAITQDNSEPSFVKIAKNQYLIENNITEWSVTYITDYLGRVVANENISQSNELMDLNGLASGVYLLHIKNNEGLHQTVKIQITQ